jgi:hypothetical protein
MAIFEAAIMAGSVKASRAMKMDIVNPIPPTAPAPRMWRQETPWGSCVRPKVTAARQNGVMPSGLPTKSPRKMPRAFRLVSPDGKYRLA